MSISLHLLMEQYWGLIPSDPSVPVKHQGPSGSMFGFLHLFPIRFAPVMSEGLLYSTIVINAYEKLLLREFISLSNIAAMLQSWGVGHMVILLESVLLSIFGLLGLVNSPLVQLFLEYWEVCLISYLQWIINQVDQQSKQKKNDTIFNFIKYKI